jgi:signal-transduction protein with cAMP-binding, CBS, and nucleotidyltransferase domain
MWIRKIPFLKLLYEESNLNGVRRTRKIVRDLMQIVVVTCPVDTVIADLTRLALEKDLDSIIVTDPAEGNAVGVVTQFDLVRAHTHGKTEVLTAMDILQEEIPQIPPEIPLTTAAQMMLDNNIRTYFLMHHAGGVLYPTAYISYKLILRHLPAQEDEDLRGLGVVAERITPLKKFVEKRDAARRSVLKH